MQSNYVHFTSAYRLYRFICDIYIGRNIYAGDLHDYTFMQICLKH